MLGFLSADGRRLEVVCRRVARPCIAGQAISSARRKKLDWSSRRYSQYDGWRETLAGPIRSNRIQDRPVRDHVGLPATISRSEV